MKENRIRVFMHNSIIHFRKGEVSATQYLIGIVNSQYFLIANNHI